MSSNYTCFILYWGTSVSKMEMSGLTSQNREVFPAHLYGTLKQDITDIRNVGVQEKLEDMNTGLEDEDSHIAETGAPQCNIYG